MSSLATEPTAHAAAPDTPKATPPILRRRSTSLFSRGEPIVWCTGGALVLCLALVAGLLSLVTWQGGRAFWPRPLLQLVTPDGQVFLGEVTAREDFEPTPKDLESLDAEVRSVAESSLAASGGTVERVKLRTANFDLAGTHSTWVDDFLIAEESNPDWAVVVERRTNGRFHGFLDSVGRNGEVQSRDPEAILAILDERLPEVLERLDERLEIVTVELGRVAHREERARLALRSVELSEGVDSDAWRAEERSFQTVQESCRRDSESIRARIQSIDDANARWSLGLVTADGERVEVPLAEIVRAYPANRLGLGARLSLYWDRWWEFLSDDPRASNSEGGVFPAIFGTVVMTILMSIVVVPFGVLAALYLREYAKQGMIVSAVRIAVNNLAGVPSVVFGVFGFGFFCYVVGAGIDDLFFAERAPEPTFGTGGIMWAALTLALLTLPVVIVAAEEALSAVPNSMREGSFACGATKWQTIRRIVLPRAMPGILTGMILAVARGAGEVAPLMLVGASMMAPGLPIDNIAFPYVHPERSFMHLGYHIYHVGFHSQDSEAAKPLVYATTMLLIAIVVMLNLVAIWVRARLRTKFAEAA